MGIQSRAFASSMWERHPCLDNREKDFPPTIALSFHSVRLKYQKRNGKFDNFVRFVLNKPEHFWSLFISIPAMRFWVNRKMSMQQEFQILQGRQK